MTLEIPTPESLEAEANDLEVLAEKKDKLADATWASSGGSAFARLDAAIFREEAASKRAKAKRLLKKDIEAGLRTPSGTLVSTIKSMHDQRQKHWEDYLSGKESDFS